MQAARPFHWHVLDVVAKIGWFSLLELQPMIAALINSISFIITQPSLSTFSLSTPTRSLEKDRILHLHVCNQQSQNSLRYGHDAVCHHGHYLAQEKWSSNLIMNEEEMNLTWPAGKQTRSVSVLMSLLQAPAYKDIYR